LSDSKINIADWHVMPAQCRTCPFGEHGDKELMNQVIQRTALQCSQICHHPALTGKPETHLCRGARDYQLQLLHRMGLIDEATDEAFRIKSEEYRVKSSCRLLDGAPALA
jgi:hypothetical protein